MEISVFELSLPVTKLVWWLIRGHLKTHAVQSYTNALTSMVGHARDRHPLYVSVGTADFVSQWLDRIYREGSQRGSDDPKIDSIVLKRLDYTRVKIFQDAGILATNFREKLEANIDSIRTNPGITRNNIKVEERVWKRLPPFHGYMFGRSLLIGPWAVDEAGKLHAQTPIVETCEAATPERHRWARSQFDSSD